MERRVRQIDKMCERDKLKRRRCVEEHDDSVENQSNMTNKRQWRIRRMDSHCVLEILPSMSSITI